MTEHAKKRFWAVFLIAILLLGLAFGLWPESAPAPGVHGTPMVDPPVGIQGR